MHDCGTAVRQMCISIACRTASDLSDYGFRLDDRSVTKLTTLREQGLVEASRMLTNKHCDARESTSKPMLGLIPVVGHGVHRLLEVGGNVGR